MRRTTTSAKQHLKELQDHYRELEEQMLAVFADVLDQTLHTPEDNATLGQGVRDILAQHGGAEVLRGWCPRFVDMGFRPEVRIHSDS